MFRNDNLIDTRFHPVDESILAIRSVDFHSLTRARWVFQSSPSMTPQVLDLISQADQRVLAEYCNVKNSDIAYQAIAEQVATILERERRHWKDIVLTMKSLLNFVPLTRLCDVVVSEVFLNAPEFPNVFIMFKMFEKCVTTSANKSAIAKWEALPGQIRSRIQNPVRWKLLQSHNVYESLLCVHQVE
jgi:hypothetical protein